MSETLTGPAPAGINVIGHVSGNLGLGVVARNLVGLAQSLGRAVSVYDVVAGAGRSQHDAAFDKLAVATLDALPHAINVFVVGLAGLDSVLAACPSSFFDGSRLNAVVCFWELPTLPTAGVAALDRMDVVIAATDYMEATFRQFLSRAWVIAARIPVTPPAATVDWDRQRHGIPPDAIVFVCGFEPKSDPNRKNPFGVIEAFLQGAGAIDAAWLLIRVNNAASADGRLDGVVGKLERAAGGHPRIRLLTEPMSYAEVVGLYRGAQVYVSLHRAEGLGLGMAEAMLMERPVIATAWSGNMSFMSHATGCLVGYRLLPVQSTLDTYGAAGRGGKPVWADARLDEAAALMRLLAQDAALRQRIGRRAHAAMTEYNRQAAEGAFLDELESILLMRDRLGAGGFERHRSTPLYARGRLPTPSALRRAWWRLQRAIQRARGA